MNPLEELPKLIERLERYQHINSGGCGVIATHVAKHLQHHVPVKIVVYNRFERDVKEVRARIKNTRSMTEWNNAGMSFNHILIEFKYDGKTYLFDSEGVIPNKKRVEIFGYNMQRSGYLTWEECAGISSRPHKWNWIFDRKQIPAIKKTIHRFFDKFEVV